MLSEFRRVGYNLIRTLFCAGGVVIVTAVGKLYLRTVTTESFGSIESAFA